MPIPSWSVLGSPEGVCNTRRRNMDARRRTERDQKRSRLSSAVSWPSARPRLGVCQSRLQWRRDRGGHSVLDEHIGGLPFGQLDLIPAYSESHAERAPAGPYRIDLDRHRVVLASRMPVLTTVLDDDEVTAGCLERTVAATHVLQPRQERVFKELVIPARMHHSLSVAIAGRDAHRKPAPVTVASMPSRHLTHSLPPPAEFPGI